MANPEHLKILEQGVDAWNEWSKKQSWLKDVIIGNVLFQNSTTGANFSGADLSNRSLMKANLFHAIFDDANISNSDFRDASLGEASFINASLVNANFMNADMRGVNLFGAKLRDADFRYADLSGSNLMGCDLTGGNFQGANLSNVDFTGSNLSDTHTTFSSGAIKSVTVQNLHGANLSFANLKSAILEYADLSNANLQGVDLEAARFKKTILNNTNLCNAKNLLSCKHGGPSVIDYNTIIKSKSLPKEFLNGCGLNDWQIESAKLSQPDLRPDQISYIISTIEKLRIGNPVQIHNLFISYSHSDSKFIEHLEKHLKNRKVLFWRDVHDATAGPLEKVVVRAMKQNPVVLIVLSKASTKSDWVQFEVRKARELELDLERNILCPIALDDSWKISGWPERVRQQIEEYNILDFSKWESESEFKMMFEKLIKGLQLFYKKDE